MFATEMSGERKICRDNPGRNPKYFRIKFSEPIARRDRDRSAAEGGSGFSDARRETERAHTAQVRAVFEQLRAGRKAAFLSPLHRASARRREREMAKPWSGGVRVLLRNTRGRGKGYEPRIYDIPIVNRDR